MNYGMSRTIDRPFDEINAGVVVEMINPQMMAEITEGSEMAQIADEVTEKLSAALASLK